MIMQILRKLCLTLFLLAGAGLSGLHAQKVGLVLSGGGAKGLAHIGVIKALEENNIPIDYICGTSMGSIVGGLYAIGLSPEEMMVLFNTPEFRAWYTGNPEKGYEYPLLKRERKPEFVSITLSRKKSRSKEAKTRWKLNLPTSLVSPYPMDLAVLQIFAAANGAARNDFDSLMIPFFCVSADIANKSEYVARRGDLGSAIRSSMTYPLYFKPIVIDSTLLFDGGFYNNFPWEKMENYYHPDVLIGSKCVRGEYTVPEDDDIVSQVETMLTTTTDYEIPEEKGIVIRKAYDYGLMDFDKVNEIAAEGYEEALKWIPELKRRIAREMPDSVLMQKRIAFRKKWKPVLFDDLEIEGDISDAQRRLIEDVINGRSNVSGRKARKMRNAPGSEYLSDTLTAMVTPSDPKKKSSSADVQQSQKKCRTFSFFDMKKGYYQLVAIGGLNTIYPRAVKNSDSTYLLKLRVSEASPLRLSIGANISSSVLNQGYVGVSYSKFGRTSWTADADLHIGRFYSGAVLSFKHNFVYDPLAYYEIEGVAHEYDFYSPMSSFFVTSNVEQTIKENETFVSASVATPASFLNSVLVKFRLTGGISNYRYFTDDIYSNYDRVDRTSLKYISPAIVLERNTANFLMYPTAGKRQSLSIKYIYGRQNHRPGTTSDQEFVISDQPIHDLRFRLRSETYYKITNWLDFGLYVDVALGPEVDFGNYKSALMYRPEFSPFPHAKTMLLENYRAANFAGITFNPIFKITPTVLFHTSIGYFQPYKTLEKRSKGRYVYSDPFPRGGFVGNLSAVWQSPIGPVSLSVSYYEQSKIKWFPQFNLGFLLFKDRFLSN